MNRSIGNRLGKIEKTFLIGKEQCNRIVAILSSFGPDDEALVDFLGPVEQW
jgi:hypothetical protein